MLPKELRFPLRQHPEFFVQSRSFHGKFLQALYLSTPESSLRCSVIVKKIHGTAVERAKTRRRVGAAITELHSQGRPVFTRPYAVVFLVRGRPQSYEMYYAEVEYLLTELEHLSRE